MSDNTLDVQMIHDLMLATKPSEASHDASLCPLCDGSVDGADSHTDDTLGGDVSTYTQDELDTAVAEAVEPLQVKLDALLAEQGLAEFEARLIEMTEAHEAKVAELQAEIDTAVAASEAAKAEHDGLVSYLNEIQEAEAAEAALAARKEEVAAAVAGIFSDEYVAERIEGWAALEVEAFEALVADWTAAAEAAKAALAQVEQDSDEDAATEEPAVSTAMQHGVEGSERSVADIRRSLQTRGNEVRTVGATYTGGVA